MIKLSAHNPITLKVLLLEDNISLAEEMVTFLSTNGMIVSHCSNLIQLDNLLAKDRYQLLILDRLLPDGDSINHIEAIRSLHSGYIIMLSALGMSNDRIAGLNSGVDYYLAKPVDLNELLAVSRSVMRKTDSQAMTSDWHLSEEKKAIHAPSDTEIALTGSEFNLLKTLMQQPNTVLKRESIVENLGFKLEHYDVRRLDTLVCRLRAKIRNASGEDIPVHTFSKVGYAWKSNAPEHNESH